MHELEREILRTLNRIELTTEHHTKLLAQILHTEIHTMLDLEELTREVEETKGAAASTKVLVKGIIKELKDLKTGDPATQAKIDQLSKSLQSSQDDLAAAVEENSEGGSAGGIQD